MIAKEIETKKQLSKMIENNSKNFELLFHNFKNTNKIILNHKKSLLLNGDVLQEDFFDKEYFDLIITSPPYNVDIKYNSHNDDLTYDEYLKFSEIWIRNCFKWTKNQGRFCLNIPLDKRRLLTSCNSLTTPR